MCERNDPWIDVLEILKKRFSAPSFETWLKPTKARVEGSTWFVIAQNEFAKDWLISRYLPDIKDAISQITNEFQNVSVIVEEQYKRGDQDFKIDSIVDQIQSLTFSERERLFSTLNKVYGLVFETPITDLNQTQTFENFDIKSGNRFAYAAAKSVAAAPGKAFNPLFIYGHSRSGKTHLLHAIASFIQEHHRLEKVMYVTPDQFLKDCGEKKDIRLKYHDADVLLFDGVQFLSGNEQVQNEFFHLYNSLYERSKQIVMTSDSHPKEIPLMGEQLQERFEWGLVTDLVSETEDGNRVASLEKEVKLLKETLLKLERKVNEVAGKV